MNEAIKKRSAVVAEGWTRISVTLEFVLGSTVLSKYQGDTKYYIKGMSKSQIKYFKSTS